MLLILSENSGGEAPVLTKYPETLEKKKGKHYHHIKIINADAKRNKKERGGKEIFLHKKTSRSMKGREAAITIQDGGWVRGIRRRKCSACLEGRGFRKCAGFLLRKRRSVEGGKQDTPLCGRREKPADAWRAQGRGKFFWSGE